MKVTYISDTKATKTTKGDDVTLENSKVYKCMEREYYSGLFVRISLESGEHVKVKRSEIKKV
ncbi:MAG: hypothetical protein V3S16_16180 [Candidatus Desulfatibia sp.]|jgi:hypothetical protein|uniref:hypothetical protein n=1 Tax=Candidatus Desulfatibia sp. TaxID=3101189 RepID=UPI002F2EA6F8